MSRHPIVAVQNLTVIIGFDQGLIGLRLNGCRDITIPYVVHAAHVCGIQYRNPAIGDGDWIISTSHQFHPHCQTESVLGVEIKHIAP